MLSTLLLPLVAASAFPHPNPQPPPALPPAIYRERQARVVKELEGCAATLASQGDAAGVTEDFRQDSDFLWLTGVNEKGGWLVLHPKGKFIKTALYLRSRDPEAERWTGPRDPLSPALKDKFGVDAVRRGKGDRVLLELGQEAGCLAILAPPTLKDDRDDVAALRQAASALGVRLVYKRQLLERLREAHGPEELALMEQAIAITRKGHEAAARATIPGISERDVQTQLEYAFFAAGATGLSYSSIVGSGENGAVLHWDQNSRMLRDGDLVVVDAAAEYGRYAADVTRTFPVSGRFSEEQAKAYRAVYQAQEDIFATIRAGATMPDLQRAAENSLRKAGYLDKFIHGFGHFVGLDVHDAGDYLGPLPAGAVITVEPGVYLPERGFGVRIEDEVLVTESGYRLLTKGFPRKLEDVERWVQEARR
ncbi:MAG: aminopeptidase P family protein [Deltaproteobacteria bacterium]|nr:MAG: aminopeptidase P family protein [Deltaproteobacteria bacterium]